MQKHVYVFTFLGKVQNLYQILGKSVIPGKAKKSWFQNRNGESMVSGLYRLCFKRVFTLGIKTVSSVMVAVIGFLKSSALSQCRVKSPVCVGFGGVF